MRYDKLRSYNRTMLSVIIPTYSGTYLLETIKSILENAEGKVEIFVNVDSGKPFKLPKEDKRVTFHYLKSPIGMRGGVNNGLRRAKGDYVMKCDSHCVFAPGFDKELTEHMEDDWLVIPRRYGLYADGWKREERFPPKDYHYLSYPTHIRGYGKAMVPVEWKEMAKQRKDYPIDDIMTFQGSCYIANRKYFEKRVGLLDDRPETYSPFGGEQIEVGLKYWLGGGKVKVNKNAWYAHLFKNTRHYKEVADAEEKHRKEKMKANGGWKWATAHWLKNEEPKMVHEFSWLVEKFWPVPTWPEDRKLWVY